MKRKLIYRLTGMVLAGLLVIESMDLTAVAMGSALVFASESEVQEEAVDVESIPSEQEQLESAEETIVQESRQEETTLVDEAEVETEMSENENTAVSEAESEANTTEQESITEDNKENNEKEEGEADTVMTSADDIASGTYENVTWVIDKDGKLTVKGTGDYDIAPWRNYASQIKTAEIQLSDITKTSRMFYRCENLEEVDLSNLDTSNVTNMSEMFWWCRKLKKLDVSNFNTSNVTDMSGTFGYCDSLQSLNIENFNTSKVTDMSSMFDSCMKLEELKLGNFDTSKVENMRRMFYCCFAIKNVDAHNFNTGKVTNMEGMFSSCFAIEQLNMESWDVKNVEKCESILADCSALTYLKTPKNLTQKVFLPHFQNEKLWISSGNFVYLELPREMDESIELVYKVDSNNCVWVDDSVEESLNNIKWTLDKNGKLIATGTGDWNDYVPWINAAALIQSAEINISGSTYTFRMFDGCINLRQVDVRNLDVSKVTDLGCTFEDCERLESLDLSTWDASNVTRASIVFYGCSSLKKINTPKNLKISISLPAGTWVNPDGETVTELPMNMSTSILLEKKEQEPEEESSEAGESSETEESSEIEESSVEESDSTEESSEVEESSAEPESSENEESSAEPESSETEESGTEPESSGTEESSESPKSESEPDLFDGIYIKKIASQTYSGSAVKPQVEVYYNKKLLQEKTDYTVTYKNNINAGKATVTVKGKGNLTGSVTESFTIEPKNINDTDVIIEDRAFIYDGKAHKTAPAVEYKGKKLKLGKDFTVTYSEGDYTEKGTYMVSVKGCGNYTGINNDAKITITDNGKNISKAKVSKIPTQEYNSGNAIVLPENLLTVTLNKVQLTAGKDYDVSYTNNINPGKATVIIKGKGEYAGTKKVTFTIRRTPAQLTDRMVINKDVIGSVQIVKGGCRPEPVLKSGDYTLIQNTDYTVSYKNNKNVGNKAFVVVKGKGNYKGSITIPFTITEKSITSSDISIRVPDVPYTGRANKYKSTPAITDADGTALKAGKDYTVDSYSIDGVALDKKSNPENGSVITVTISGKGNYAGTTSLLYRLNGTSITKAKIKLSNKAYTGRSVEIGQADIVSATIRIGKEDKPLTLGKDFEIVAYSNNIKKGNATVIIKGIGAYAGEKKVTFKITAGTITK